ncbi:MAG: hypothetical protein P0Y60_02020 [Candidatus Microbacterium colombiense]|nr:MAG: hypothetical protein P0Y60_02020 [Microbacterium sp.]
MNPEVAESIEVRGDRAHFRAELNGRWALAQTPGERWFAVDTDQGFSWNRFDEDASASEINMYLDTLVDVARAYVEGRYSLARSPALRAPELQIVTENETAVLTLGLPDLIRRFFRR